MAKKPFVRKWNSFGESFIELTSAGFPSFIPYAILYSVLIVANFFVGSFSMWVPLLVALLSLVFGSLGRSVIAIKHDLVQINGDAPNKMNRFTLKLNNILLVKEKANRNPMFSGRIGVSYYKEDATLHGMGTSRHLTPRGVLVLAELQRLGAKVTFPGFGGKGEQAEEEQHNLSDRLHRIEALVAVSPLLFFLVALSFEITGNLPSFTPWHYLLGFIPWLIYLVFYIGSSLLEQKSYAKTTKDSIEVCLQGRLKQEVPWHDIKQILITVHPTKLWFESVSVHLVTHYNRTHTLVNRELTLVRGALDIIDLARSRGVGVKVVYQDAADEEEVFLDIKQEEKPLPREQITPAAELNQDVVVRA